MTQFATYLTARPAADPLADTDSMLVLQNGIVKKTPAITPLLPFQSGAGAPEGQALAMVIGEHYLDNSSGDIWAKAAEPDTWEFRTNIRGSRWLPIDGDPNGQALAAIAGRDIALDTATGDYYLKVAEPDTWTLIGQIRPQEILSGVGDPDGTIGRDGDWYIQTATLTLYGPRTVGAWGAGVALQGPQGIPGSAGGALSAVWADALTIAASMALAGYDTIYLGNTASGSLAWTAPTAIGHKGRQMYIENIGTAGNAVTVAGNGAETIEGQASLDLTDGTGRTFYSDGANWRIKKG